MWISAVWCGVVMAQMSQLSDFDALAALVHLRELAVLNNPLTRCGHDRAALVLALARLHVLDRTVVGNLTLRL